MLNYIIDSAIGANNYYLKYALITAKIYCAHIIDLKAVL